MAELKFDRPEPELTDAEDDMTLASIEEGIGQMDADQGIPIEELRKEFQKRCSN